jgi:hypothetical protein
MHASFARRSTEVARDVMGCYSEIAKSYWDVACSLNE